jgi:hypothetical protein
VIAQTREGVPVLEIHGQGDDAAVQDQVTGVLGRRDAVLCQELQRTFRWFPMNWEQIAIPRCGGAVVESFNVDQVRRKVFTVLLSPAAPAQGLLESTATQMRLSARSNTLNNNGCV